MIKTLSLTTLARINPTLAEAVREAVPEAANVGITVEQLRELPIASATLRKQQEIICARLLAAAPSNTLGTPRDNNSPLRQQIDALKPPKDRANVPQSTPRLLAGDYTQPATIERTHQAPEGMRQCTALSDDSIAFYQIKRLCIVGSDNQQTVHQFAEAISNVTAAPNGQALVSLQYTAPNLYLVEGANQQKVSNGLLSQEHLDPQGRLTYRAGMDLHSKDLAQGIDSRMALKTESIRHRYLSNGTLLTLDWPNVLNWYGANGEVSRRVVGDEGVIVDLYPHPEAGVICVAGQSYPKRSLSLVRYGDDGKRLGSVLLDHESLLRLPDGQFLNWPGFGRAVIYSKDLEFVGETQTPLGRATAFSDGRVVSLSQGVASVLSFPSAATTPATTATAATK